VPNDTKIQLGADTQRVEPAQLSLRELFERVSSVPRADRRAALMAQCKDPAMIEQVFRMCALADEEDTQIAAPISSATVRTLASVGSFSDELDVGQQLGNWQLTGRLGQGGMGTVFLAKRADGHFDQLAAVKVLQGFPTESSRARLAEERQILAQLTHPNIARLFDGGATPKGHPYLVLEYIRGQTIDQYCASKQLSLRAVIELLLPVCGAIAFAHQRLVVHCDVKPANILVTDAGQPILLDFGVANLMASVDAVVELKEDHLATTGFQVSELQKQRAVARKRIAHATGFTPKYASPEQKAAQALTTATDVFSLGRVLDELTSAPAVRQQRDQLLASEVRAIIEYACAADPAQRYVTINDMAADLRRALTHQPVHAFERASYSPGYALRKWLNRNVVRVLSALVAVCLLVAVGLQLVAERDNAVAAQARAEQERDNARVAARQAFEAREKAIAARRELEQQLKAAQSAGGQ
jgi:eukaryotic-like serine/threonine-protein kinase